MAIDYAHLRDVAKRLIGDNGVEFGVSRPGAISRDTSGNEVISPALSFKAYGVTVAWSFAEQVGGIKAGEIKMAVSPEQEIKNGDIFTAANGEKYRVTDANPVQPAGLLLLFKPRMVQVR